MTMLTSAYRVNTVSDASVSDDDDGLVSLCTVSFLSFSLFFSKVYNLVQLIMI